MVVEENNQYALSRKTGWSVNEDENNGWFFGYVEIENGMYFFATNIEPKNKLKIESFIYTRKEGTYKALKAIRVIN